MPVTMLAGQKAPATVKFTDSFGNEIPTGSVLWSSSDDSAIQVTRLSPEVNAEVLSLGKAGVYQVFAASGGVTIQDTVTVDPKPISTGTFTWGTPVEP